MDTVRDLIGMDIDIDVYDDVCEDLAIAFIGPMELTKVGEKEFAEVLDYGFEHCAANKYGDDAEYILIQCDDPDEKVWKQRVRNARRFFYAAAGYCREEEYKRWFKEDK